jgi:hypothetical protein
MLSGDGDDVGLTIYGWIVLYQHWGLLGVIKGCGGIGCGIGCDIGCGIIRSVIGGGIGTGTIGCVRGLNACG